MGLYLVARLFELRGQDAEALTMWSRILGAYDDAEARLSRARLSWKNGDFDGAYVDIRTAIEEQDDYIFFNRAAKVFTKLRRQRKPAAQRSIRLALVSSSTTNLLAPILQLECFRRGIDADIYIAPYGNVFQEILNPASELYTFRAGCRADCDQLARCSFP